MRSRAWLFGVVATGVAVAAILFLWPRSTNHDAELGTQPVGDGAKGVERPEATAPAPAPAPPDGDTEAGGPDRPDSQASSGGPRDHRGETPTNPRQRRLGRGQGRVVQPKVIAELRRVLGPEIEKCSAQHAADLQPDAQIRGALRVTVQSGVVSVLDVKVEPRGVPESSGMIECARKAFAAAQVRADDHSDVDGHMVRLPFRISAR